MISPILSSKIYSVLANSDSLIPMGIKDTANSLGLTAGSYITGQAVESHDRFIDEFGTQAIWLLGIPAYKKIIDWVMFKPMGYDAGVDVRIMKDPEVLKLAKKYAKQHDEKFKNNKNVKQIAENIEKAAANSKVFKGLTFGKFVAATALTILSYGGLTKFRHNYRENKIKKEFFEKQETIKKEKEIQQKSAAKKTKETSFTGGLQDFMFSPVKNMMIVDGVITGQRLGTSKNPQEFMQYCIKEGFFWFFMYFAGDHIKKYLENHSIAKNKLPIDMDSRALNSKELKEALLNDKIMDSIYEFPVSDKPTNAEIYKFVNETPDNLVVQMSKKSGIVSTVKERTGLFSKPKDTGSVDNRKYVSTEDVVGIKNKLKVFYEKGQEFIKSEADKLGMKVEDISVSDKSKMLEAYLEKVKKANGKAALKNIGACIGVLGVLMPSIIVAWRLLDKDNQGYRVREDIENKLRAQIPNA